MSRSFPIERTPNGKRATAHLRSAVTHAERVRLGGQLSQRDVAGLVALWLWARRSARIHDRVFQDLQRVAVRSRDRRRGAIAARIQDRARDPKLEVLHRSLG